MADSLRETSVPSSERTDEIEEFDAIVIGSGVTGLYSLYRMRQLGFSVRAFDRSEEHTSELQSRTNLVCRLLLEKKKKSYAVFCLTKTLTLQRNAQIQPNT